MYEPGYATGGDSLNKAPGCLLWAVALLWVVVNVAAAWLGDLLRLGVVGFFSPAAVDAPGALSIQGHIEAMGGLQILPELAGGIAAAAVLALAQGIVLVPFLKATGIVEWTAATIIGRTVGWMAIYIATQEMVRLVISKENGGLCLLFAALVGTGVISGLSLGYAQGIVWRRRTSHPGWWVLANIPGPVIAAIMVMVALYVGTENTIRDGTILIAGLVTGVCTAITLMDLLRYPTQEAEWVDMFKNRKSKKSLPGEEIPETTLGSSLYERRTPKPSNKPPTA